MEAPSNIVVHISAAITAYARIHMYLYISRDECYYTNADSTLVKNPLPEEEVSPTVLGKFKLEHLIAKGLFLAPKSYFLQTMTNDEIIKHKGTGKAMTDFEWFTNQLADMELKRTLYYENHFHKNWKKNCLFNISNVKSLWVLLIRREHSFTTKIRNGLEQSQFILARMN